MQNKIEYSPKALKDLDEIWDYIAHDLNNAIAAQHTIDGILDTVDLLSEFPESGQKLIFDGGLESGFRFVLYKKYMAFYRIQAENVIYIDRVVYGGRDHLQLLFPEL